MKKAKHDEGVHAMTPKNWDAEPEGHQRDWEKPAEPDAPARLQQIRERCEQAKEGPWDVPYLLGVLAAADRRIASLCEAHEAQYLRAEQVEAALQRCEAELVGLAVHVRALFPMDSSIPSPGHEASFIIHMTNHLSDSRRSALATCETLRQKNEHWQQLHKDMSALHLEAEADLTVLRAGIARLRDRIQAWRKDDKAGYNQAIGLLFDCADALAALAGPREEPVTD